MLPPLPSNVLYGAYVSVFTAAAVVCFLLIPRTRRVQHEDTRRGLYWLLLTSGGWAAAHVGYLVMPTVDLQYAFYVVGLVVGLAAVGPWLYFCAAYTGRSVHRDPTVRRIAVGAFVVLAGIKATNPLHGWYFVAEPTETPFAYLQIHHRPLHWIAMGLAYALTFVGFFMLFELFERVDSDTRPLFGLLGLTGLPVVFDLVGAVDPEMLDLTYASIGVAVFAVGVFSVYFDRFQFVRVTGESDDPIVVLDESGRIRDLNARAVELFPVLRGATNERLDERFPALAAAVDNPERVFERDVDGAVRYFNVSSNPFTVDGARTGQSVVLTDVTHREQYREELEEKNQQLERFASIVSHDLRNPLQVARGRTELALQEGDVEHLEPVVRAHERMEALIEDMLTLAREGVSIDEPEPVEVGALAERSWEMVAADGASLSIEPGFDRTVSGDPERLQQLFENLFRNSIEHGGGDVVITVGPLPDGTGFYVEDDGPGIPADERETVFEAGYTTSADGTGFGLAIVAEIVDAHGWEISVTDGSAGGARFEIRTE